MKDLYKISKWSSILLWLIVIIISAHAIFNHTFWNMMPIIAHNHIQNLLGWLVTIAVVLSVITPFLKLIGKDK